mmetsp:Transcript_73708/g.238249  ORF Transcript_73708/g.238249 Transcript_73708/m.238249 type:complete len:269 (+) Transcript_73708:489-1295(+)
MTRPASRASATLSGSAGPAAGAGASTRASKALSTLLPLFGESRSQLARSSRLALRRRGAASPHRPHKHTAALPAGAGRPVADPRLVQPRRRLGADRLVEARRYRPPRVCLADCAASALGAGAAKLGRAPPASAAAAAGVLCATSRPLGCAPAAAPGAALLRPSLGCRALPSQRAGLHSHRGQTLLVSLHFALPLQPGAPARLQPLPLRCSAASMPLVCVEFWWLGWPLVIPVGWRGLCGRAMGLQRCGHCGCAKARAQGRPRLGASVG